MEMEQVGITELTVAVRPWLLSMLGFLMVVTYWPGLSTTDFKVPGCATQK